MLERNDGYEEQIRARDREPGDSIGQPRHRLQDAEFAAELGQVRGVHLGVGARIRDRFVQARERYGGGAQSPKLVRLLEEAVG